MQLNKNIKIFINYLLGPFLFLWLLFSLYQQIQAQSHLESSWQHIIESLQSRKIIALAGVILLMMLNWGVEAFKWNLSVAPIHNLSFLKAFKAILSGVSFSVTMPNQVGEYAGRLMYLPEGARLKTVAVTLVGSLSQLLITLISGTISFLIMKPAIINAGMLNPMWFNFILFGLLFTITALLLVYFETGVLGKLLERLLYKSRYLYLIQSLRTFGSKLLLQLLVLSFFRYAIFMCQYMLLFYLFDVVVSVSTIWCVVSVVFLAMAAIPSIALVDVGLRGQINVQLMGLYTVNTLGVVLTSATVWFINLMLPALIGSIFILSIKVFQRNDEVV
jgi:uncharacterized membrane protein YbhN (UPF0104 family)